MVETGFKSPPSVFRVHIPNHYPPRLPRRSREAREETDEGRRRLGQGEGACWDLVTEALVPRPAVGRRREDRWEEAAKLGADIRGPLAPRQLTHRLPRPQGVQTQEQHHLQ